MASITSTVFESWIVSLNAHSQPQKQKVFLIMENYVTHFLKHVGRGGFSTLQLSKITSAFLPPNVTSMVQPLDKRIAPFNVQYQKKLVEWVLS